MESTKFTVTAAQINGVGAGILYTDVSKQFPWNNSQTSYPQEITIVNDTGIDIGMLYLTDIEKNRIVDYSGYYQSIQLLGNTIKELNVLNKWIGVQKISPAATATGNLTFYCTNYFSMMS